MKFPMQALILSLAFSLSATSFAASVPPGQFIKKSVITKYYRKNCKENVADLRQQLEDSNVRVIEDRSFAARANFLVCDFDNDPIYEKIQKDEIIKATESEIAKSGVRSFIKSTNDDYSSNHEKYKIDQILEDARVSGKISKKNLILLFNARRSKSRADSLVSTLNDYLRKSADSNSDSVEPPSNADAS